MRILVKANNSVAPLLLEEAGGLAHLIQERYSNLAKVDFSVESSAGVRVLCQEMERDGSPAGLPPIIAQDPFIQTQFNSNLVSGQYDVIVLSIEPALFLPLWCFDSEGIVFAPPAGYEQSWNTDQLTWLQEKCTPLGLPSIQSYQENLTALIHAIREKSDSHILIVNASSLLPNDTRYQYKTDTESLALRINQLNLVLLNVSSKEGISIIDVDRIIAEFGFEHIQAPLTYSAKANAVVRNEVLRVLVDMGYFENDTSVFKLSMPYVDRSIRQGRIVKWHKNVGDTISAGDDIADIEVEIIKMARTKSSMFLSRGKSSKTGGRIEQSLMRITAVNEGILREVYARPGETLPIDTLIASLTPDEHTAIPSELATASNFRVTANKIERGQA